MNDNNNELVTIDLREEIESTTKTNEFRTADVHLGAYLQTCGMPLLRVSEENHKVYFVLDTAGHDIEALKRAWFTNTATVLANQFCAHLKNLKSAIFHRRDQ